MEKLTGCKNTKIEPGTNLEQNQHQKWRAQAGLEPGTDLKQSLPSTKSYVFA